MSFSHDFRYFQGLITQPSCKNMIPFLSFSTKKQIFSSDFWTLFFFRFLDVLLKVPEMTLGPSRGYPRINLSDFGWENKILIIFLALRAPTRSAIYVFPHIFDGSSQISGWYVCQSGVFQIKRHSDTPQIGRNSTHSST